MYAFIIIIIIIINFLSILSLVLTHAHPSFKLFSLSAGV